MLPINTKLIQEFTTLFGRFFLEEGQNGSVLSAEERRKRDIVLFGLDDVLPVGDAVSLQNISSGVVAIVRIFLRAHVHDVDVFHSLSRHHGLIVPEGRALCVFGRGVAFVVVVRDAHGSW